MENNETRQPKIYLGNGREKTRKSGDKFLTASICLDDVENVPDEHIEKGNNGKRYLRIVINPYKDGPNQYGNTHSVAVDTFKPNSEYTGNTGELKDIGGSDLF